ncbi:hypothetical protein LTR85_007857 [Meristemomyces frigidus]|nr:hypothetical protein LTR85_007857 [Meristemomyces frigidus]
MSSTIDEPCLFAQDTHQSQKLESWDASIEKASPSPSPPADGGLVAWTQCANTFCLWFAAWGLVNSFGVFQAYYETHAAALVITATSPSSTSSTISWIGSLQLCFYIGGTSFIGPIFDSGHLRLLLITGTALTVFGTFMMSLGTAYWQLLLAQGVCMGLGMTCLFVPCVAVLPPWFATRRALTMGIGASGSSIGAIVFALVFQHLTPRIGFPWTVRVLAFIILASLIPPILTMRKKVAKSPTRSLIDKSALREPAFLLAGCTMLPLFAGLYIPYFYAQVFSINTDIMPPGSAYLNEYLIVLLNTGSFFGRLFPNILADRIGPLNTMVPCTLVTALLAFTWIAVTTQAGMIAFCLFYGFFSGAVCALLPVVWASLCPDMKLLGTRTGMMTVPMAAGLLIGNPIAGALVRGRSYVALQAFAGAIVLVSGCLLASARFAKTGAQVVVKV